MTELTEVGLFALLYIVTAVLLYAVTWKIFQFAEKRRHMKNGPTRKRNMMVGDLFNQMLLDRMSLEMAAFEARKAMLRASYEAGRYKGGAQDKGKTWDE
jgi:hypothetical protein